MKRPEKKDDTFMRDFGQHYHNACQIAYNQACEEWEEFLEDEGGTYANPRRVRGEYEKV